jgi:hypothetical protein
MHAPNLFKLLGESQHASSLSLQQVITFVRLCHKIKSKILATVPSKYTSDRTPPFLPGDAMRFLCIGCNMSEEAGQEAWLLLGDEIWLKYAASPEELPDSIEDIFRKSGVDLGYRTLLIIHCYSCTHVN